MKPEPRRILVADDDEDFVRRIVDVIQRLGHTVETATDGKETLQLLRSQAFDLAIIDTVMPRMDGFELLLAIQKEPLAQPVPILMLVPLSAAVEDNRRMREWVLRVGAADVIVRYRLKDSDVVEAVERFLPSSDSFSAIMPDSKPQA